MVISLDKMLKYRLVRGIRSAVFMEVIGGNFHLKNHNSVNCGAIGTRFHMVVDFD